MGWGCLAYKSYWLRDHFLLVGRSDHTAGSRNIKPEVVFKVQKMARYASFCLITGPFKGGVPVFARLWPVRPPWRAPRRRLTLAARQYVRGPSQCLVYRFTCNNRVRIKVSIRVRVSFTTGAVWSAILATAGLLVLTIPSRLKCVATLP